jgi:hypothetical protein
MEADAEMLSPTRQLISTPPLPTSSPQRTLKSLARSERLPVRDLLYHRQVSQESQLLDGIVTAFPFIIIITIVLLAAVNAPRRRVIAMVVVRR